MFNLMTQNWWAIEVRGFAAVLFGIATFMWPGITLSVLAPLFGAYALINGIFAVIEAFCAMSAANVGGRCFLKASSES